MTLEEVGAALKAERERRGLRIEDVGNKLKISPRLLTALEAGNGAALPHSAYVRGFIRSYGSMLGMSQDEMHSWLADLDASAPERHNASGTKPQAGRQRLAPEPVFRPGPSAVDAPPAPRPAPPVSAPPAPEGRDEPPATSALRMEATYPAPAEAGERLEIGEKGAGGAPGRKGGMLLPLALLLLCALAGGGWWAWQSGKLEFLKPVSVPSADLDRRLPQADAYLAARDAARAEADSREKTGEESERQTAAASPEKAPQEKPAGPESANADLALPPTQIPAQAPAEPREKPAAEAVVKPRIPEAHKLIITAVEECWVHSNADRTDTRQFSLRKGDTFALTFNKTLELKLGNAGGVRLRYDGEDLPPPGTSGQVRTISFPPQADSSN